MNPLDTMIKTIDRVNESPEAKKERLEEARIENERLEREELKMEYPERRNRFKGLSRRNDAWDMDDSDY